MRTLLLALGLGLGGLAAAAHASAQPAHPGATARPKPDPAANAANAAAVPREGIEALEAQLDRAIDRVSLPRPVALLGRDCARGYRLPGYGIVFVLTPRTLPGPDGYDVLRPRHRVEFRRVRPHPAGEDAAAGAPDAVGALERQVIVLQQETEQARRAAEEDMERIVQDVRVRHAAPGELRARGPNPRPRVLAPASPGARGSAGGARAPAPPPAPAEAPLPPPPPWKYWFDDTVSARHAHARGGRRRRAAGARRGARERPRPGARPRPRGVRDRGRRFRAGGRCSRSAPGPRRRSSCVPACGTSRRARRGRSRQRICVAASR